jgi:hypothetical protein
MVYQIYIILKKYLIVYISMLKNSELNYYIYIYIEREVYREVRKYFIQWIKITNEMIYMSHEKKWNQFPLIKN